MKFSISPIKKIIPQRETRENMFPYDTFFTGLNNGVEKNNNAAMIDHRMVKKIKTVTKAPPKTMRSAATEVPRQQLFSHVKNAIPETTIISERFHVGCNEIRSKLFCLRAPENIFGIISPPRVSLSTGCNYCLILPYKRLRPSTSSP